MPLAIWSIEEIGIMNRINAIFDDEEELETEDQSLGFWMLLPVVALGLLVYHIADAAMTSVFEESKDE
jgi:hypothetical protein